MSMNIEQPPVNTPLVTKSGKMESHWQTWTLLVLLQRLIASVFVQTVAEPSSAAPLHALVAPTALVASAAAGLYRISWHIRIAVADGVNSSVTLSILSTEGGSAITQSGAAVTGDTLQTVQSGSVLVTPDAQLPISYSVAYASNTPAKMGYNLIMSVEQLS